MPYHTSPKKRLRRDTRVRLHNQSTIQRLRTFLKKARQALATPLVDQKPGDIQQAVRTAQSMISKSAAKGIVHPRNAARRVSRLMKKSNAPSA